MVRVQLQQWVSDELRDALAELRPQQAAGVMRIVQAEIEGRTLSSLLDEADKICSRSTFYGTHRRLGWMGRPEFREALELARRDYRAWMLDHGAKDALAILAQTAPDAARVLRQQVVGDERALRALERLLRDDQAEVRSSAALQLGETDLAAAVPALVEALEQEQDAAVHAALVAALGRVAGSRDGARRAAAGEVLSRTSRDTAPKAVDVHEGDLDVGLGLAELTDDELEQMLANLQAAGRAADRAAPPPLGDG